jgi:uncharacterized protein (DUF934 family)
MKTTIKLIANNDPLAGTSDLKDAQVLQPGNELDPHSFDLTGVERVVLNFPKFTDGRAYSQAFMLRHRLGYKGEIRAVGDVLIDQLVQMQRGGFDSAVLRADQDLAHAQRQFDRFSAYYQGDAVTVAPHFARAA